MTKPLAVTLGEPAGIGPDITVAAWHRREQDAVPPFYLIGDPDFLKLRAAALGVDVPVAVVTQATAAQAFDRALPVVPTGHRVTALPGQPDASSAPAVLAAIRQAVDDATAGRAAAVVTNPIAKSVLYGSGFHHPGHTEYLAELAGRDGVTPMPVMMLWSEELAVVPTTIHVALRDAITALSSDLIIQTCRIVAADLQRYFGIAVPRLAVSGLNPHAGEDGALGSEDQTIIAPAIEALRREGLDIRGPLAADTMFRAAARLTYDCAICMYHDQALIPIKTLAFDEGVNVTLGLPFVRTSPDHGTAFALAGTGRATPSSLIAALKLAARMAEHRPTS